MVALPSTKKTHSEKHKQIFRQLLRESANKSCVDCKTSTHPRWASWNLGCFICIRCSGIHRSMGTHISRVKSVDLDAWTDEQVESMVKWGNEKCNMYWEAKLPPNYVPDGSKIENFIRTKYDMKKWASLPKVPNPMSLHPSVASTEGHTNLITTKSETVASNLPVSSSIGKTQKPELLLDDDFGSFSSASTGQPTGASHMSRNTVSKSQPTAVKSASEPPNVSMQDQRKNLKKSILSLYSTLSSSSSTLSFSNATQGSFLGANSFVGRSSPALGSQIHSQPIPPANRSFSSTAQTKTDSMASMTDSLLGLDFGTSKSASTGLNLFPIQPQTNPLQPVQASSTRSAIQTTPQDSVQPTSSWSNEWSDIPVAENPWGASVTTTNVLNGANGSAASYDKRNKDLDDDLYKNVWS